MAGLSRPGYSTAVRVIARVMVVTVRTLRVMHTVGRRVMSQRTLIRCLVILLLLVGGGGSGEGAGLSLLGWMRYMILLAESWRLLIITNFIQLFNVDMEWI